MKSLILVSTALVLAGLLSGCCLFPEKGPPPVTPPYTLPVSTPGRITPALLKEKMVDMLSMEIVSKNLAGRRIRKVSIPPGNREMALLASVAEGLAATGLITLSTSPDDPFFTSRTTPERWQVAIEQRSPKRVLLKKELLFPKD